MKFEPDALSPEGMALDGLRILDFTWVYAGPFGTMMLADMGAEVIKIESNKHPDVVRRQGPYPERRPGINRSAYFGTLNRGKRSCTLDLGNPKAIDLVKKLVRVCDGVTENYAPRVMAKLGLDYQSLRSVRPDIVMVSMSGYGATGPYKDYVSYGLPLEGFIGLSTLTGYSGGPPESLGMPLADLVGGAAGAFALLSALHYRSRSGEGQYVDLSQSEALASFIGEAVMEHIVAGSARPRRGNRDSVAVPHNCYPCEGDDKWVAIEVDGEEEWRAFCKALGDPDWTQKGRFADARSRQEHQDELDALIGEWTRGRTHYEVMRQLQAAGVAAGPSLNTEELINDPHLKERGFFVEDVHPEGGQRTIAGLFAKLSGTPGKVRRHAPLIGEHNEYVFGELLGMSSNIISQLIEERVIY